MFDIRTGEGNAIVLSGRLDAAQAAKALQILDALEHSIVADIAGLDYISSAGIGVLVKTHLRLQAGGHAMKLANPQARVRAVIHFAGLEQLFGIE